jgi:hypothetical protein
MWNLERIDKHAEVHIEIGESGKECRATCGGSISGQVTVMLRQTFGFALHLYFVVEEESLY